MTKPGSIEGLAEALAGWALGPHASRSATCWPLTASGALIDTGDWYPCPPEIRGRQGNPSITVWNMREESVTVTCSPKGKNLTVFVPVGTKIVEVE